MCYNHYCHCCYLQILYLAVTTPSGELLTTATRWVSVRVEPHRKTVAIDVCKLCNLCNTELPWTVIETSTSIRRVSSYRQIPLFLTSVCTVIVSIYNIMHTSFSLEKLACHQRSTTAIVISVSPTASRLLQSSSLCQTYAAIKNPTGLKSPVYTPKTGCRENIRPSRICVITDITDKQLKQRLACYLCIHCVDGISWVASWYVCLVACKNMWAVFASIS